MLAVEETMEANEMVGKKGFQNKSTEWDTRYPQKSSSTNLHLPILFWRKKQYVALVPVSATLSYFPH